MSVLTEKLLAFFNEQYGENSNVRLYFSPGRVNLIGEHTDYNGGHVFPCALSMGTYAAAAKREDKTIRLFSGNFPESGVYETSLDDIKAEGWTKYPLGVLQTLAEQNCFCDCGFDMVIYGDLPDGAGLSSSASIELLTGTMLCDLYGFEKTPVELALAGQHTEHEYVGIKCGIMDQFVVAVGKKDHAVFLDTNTLEYELVPVELQDACIVITDSKVKHSLASSAYNDRRKDCQDALAEIQAAGGDFPTLGDMTDEDYEKFACAITTENGRKRAKHAVSENRRTIRAVEVLKAGDIEEFGRLMNATHVSLRDDYEVSCEETDILAELAWCVPGVIGSRITGGGFGGCTVSIVKADAVETFKKVVGENYKKKTGKEAAFYIADIADGARRLS